MPTQRILYETMPRQRDRGEATSMTEQTHGDDRRKRVVTTDGNPLGWAVRDGDGTLHVAPDPGVFRGCDSWLSPSWDEASTYQLDDDAVVGVGHSTVVLAGASVRGTGGRDESEEALESESDAHSTEEKNADVDP